MAAARSSAAAIVATAVAVSCYGLGVQADSVAYASPATVPLSTKYAAPSATALVARMYVGTPPIELNLELRFDVDDAVLVLYRDQSAWSLTYAREGPSRGSDLLTLNMESMRVPVICDPARASNAAARSQCVAGECDGVFGAGPLSHTWDLWPDISVSYQRLSAGMLHPLLHQNLAAGGGIVSATAEESVALVACDDSAGRFDVLCKSKRVCSVSVVPAYTSTGLPRVASTGRGEGVASVRGRKNFPFEEEEDARRAAVVARHTSTKVPPAVGTTTAAPTHASPTVYQRGHGGAVIATAENVSVTFSMNDRYTYVPQALYEALIDHHNLYGSDDDEGEGGGGGNDFEMWPTIEIRVPVVEISSRTAGVLADMGVLEGVSAAVEGKGVDAAESSPFTATSGEIVLRIRAEDYLFDYSTGESVQRTLLVRGGKDASEIVIGSDALKRYVFHKHAAGDVLLLLHHHQREHFPIVSLLSCLFCLWILCRWHMVSPENLNTTLGNMYELAASALAFAPFIDPDGMMVLSQYGYVLPASLVFLFFGATVHAACVLLSRTANGGGDSVEMRALRVISYKATLSTALWLILCSRRGDALLSTAVVVVHAYVLQEAARIIFFSAMYRFSERHRNLTWFEEKFIGFLTLQTLAPPVDANEAKRFADAASILRDVATENPSEMAGRSKQTGSAATAAAAGGEQVRRRPAAAFTQSVLPPGWSFGGPATPPEKKKRRDGENPKEPVYSGVQNAAFWMLYAVFPVVFSAHAYLSHHYFIGPWLSFTLHHYTALAPHAEAIIYSVSVFVACNYARISFASRVVSVTTPPPAQAAEAEGAGIDATDAKFQ